MDRPRLRLEHQSKHHLHVLHAISIVFCLPMHECYHEPGTGEAAVDASAVAISSGRLRSAVGAGILFNMFNLSRNDGRIWGLILNLLSRILSTGQKKKNRCVRCCCKQAKQLRPCGMISWKFVSTSGKSITSPLSPFVDLPASLCVFSAFNCKASSLLHSHLQSRLTAMAWL